MYGPGMGWVQSQDKQHLHLAHIQTKASLLAPRSRQIQIQIKLKLILIQMDRRDMITFIVVYFLCEMVTAKGKGERHSASLGGPTRPIGQGRNMYFPESLIM